MKRLRNILATLTLIAAVLQVAAQNDSWRLHTGYSAPVADMAFIGHRLFVLSGGGLFSRDFATDETVTHTSLNGLNGDIVECMAPCGNGLVVAYGDGNIDVLTSEGTVRRNIPWIKTSSVESKHINSLWTSGDTCFVAGDFGYCEINLADGEVIRSSTGTQTISRAVPCDSAVVLATSDAVTIIPRYGHIGSVANYSRIPVGETISGMGLTRTGIIFVMGQSGTVYRLNIDRSNVAAIEPVKKVWGRCNIVRSSDGTVLIKGDNQLYNLAGDATPQWCVTLPDAIKGSALAVDGTMQRVASADAEGIGLWNLSTAPATMLSAKARPEEMSVRDAAFLTPSRDGARLYVSNLGQSAFRTARTQDDEGMTTVSAVSVLEDGQWRDVSVDTMRAFSSLMRYYQDMYGEPRFLSPTRIVEDPDDPDIYYAGTGNDGVYRISGRQVDGHYDDTNSPMPSAWGVRVYEVNIDDVGNLWCVAASDGTSNSGPAVLPADKRRLHPSAVTPTDWLMPARDWKITKDARLLFSRNTPMVYGIDIYSVMLYDRGSDASGFDDDTHAVYDRLTDTDGNIFAPEMRTSLMEDRQGRLWIGTTDGVVVVDNPAQSLSEGLRVRRVKVPRNDGTNQADYLLQGQTVTGMSQDNAGHVWLATADAGVYVVTADGDEILQRYTKENSPLPTNRVSDVYADPSSRSVWMATSYGVVEYTAGAAPSADDLGSVAVYPNPVTPDYGGEVTVTGLMDGSLVKIMNASGTVMAQRRAEGGSVQWDATTAGRRVPSGVYYVMVVAPEGSNATAVAKIMVIN